MSPGSTSQVDRFSASRIALALFATLALFMTFAFSMTPYVKAVTAECPAGGVKTESVTDGDLDDVVLAEGTEFCVKSSTEATGTLTADGETTLCEYLLEAGIVGGNPDECSNVSHYIVYTPVVGDDDDDDDTGDDDDDDTGDDDDDTGDDDDDDDTGGGGGQADCPAGTTLIDNFDADELVVGLELADGVTITEVNLDADDEVESVEITNDSGEDITIALKGGSDQVGEAFVIEDGESLTIQLETGKAISNLSVCVENVVGDDDDDTGDDDDDDTGDDDDDDDDNSGGGGGGGTPTTPTTPTTSGTLGSTGTPGSGVPNTAVSQDPVSPVIPALAALALLAAVGAYESLRRLQKVREQ